MLAQNERPRIFDEMVGQEYVVENIRNQSKKNTWFQCYILGGQYGSGKTTMAKIIAMAANCSHRDVNGNPCLKCPECRAIMEGTPDFREIDGASNTGIDNIRELQEYARYRPVHLRKKVIIIDEVHKLSNAAFNSLLKLLEEPPAYIMFILCTTDVDAIPLTVQSRCACYRFGPISDKHIRNHLLVIAEKNHLDLTEEAATLIAKYASGAMRNALQLMEQLSAAGEKITEELCMSVLGLSQEEVIFSLLRAFLTKSYSEIVKILDAVSEKGKDFFVLSKDLEMACADLIIAKCTNIDNVNGTLRYKAAASELSKEFPLSKFCAISNLMATFVRILKQESTKQQFFIQSVALIQELHRDSYVLAEEVEKLKEELVQHTQVRGLNKAQLSIAEEPEEKELFYRPAETPAAVSQTGVMEKEQCNNDMVVESPSQAEDQDAEEATEDSFDEDYFEHLFSQCDQKTFEKTVEEPPKQEQSPIKDEEKSVEIANYAEFQLMELIKEEPEIAMHINCGCIKEHTKDNLILKTPERAVANLLLLFIGRAEIKNIRVIYDPDTKLEA